MRVELTEYQIVLKADGTVLYSWIVPADMDLILDVELRIWMREHRGEYTERARVLPDGEWRDYDKG